MTSMAIIDQTLEQASENNKSTVLWGKYDKHYDWVWHNDRPYLAPNGGHIATEVLLRDWTVAEKLMSLGVRRVLDIGSDTGHFIAVLKHFGIEAVGVDASSEACDFVNSRGQNKCYQVDLESLITLDLKGYDCITCMNITQAKWQDESLKSKLISWISERSTYTVLSDITHQDKHWNTLKLVHDFNPLPLYFSGMVYRVAKRMGFGDTLNYLAIQKCYKVR